jgi:hypothetical protein
LFAEAVASVPFVGKLLAKMVLQRRWKLILGCVLMVWMLVVYPLLVPILAAFVINKGMLFGWQEGYAQHVRAALHVEEAARQMVTSDNRNLDYFQVIEFQRSANQSQKYSFSVQPYQRVHLRKEEINLVSVDPSRCAVPLEMVKKGTKLFELQAGEVHLLDLRSGYNNESYEITRQDWERIVPRVDKGWLAIDVLPVPPLSENKCDELKAEIRLTIEVFKDLVPMEGTAMAVVPK